MLTDYGVERLKNNPYPGRGIVIGLSPDKNKYFQIYWIMGRSEQSRNRIFYNENGTVYTKVFDESKVINPELLIYPAIKSVSTKHIVTNGSHTNTIEKYLKNGKSFFEALFEEKYEPDPPHYTPRISGIIDIENDTFILSILKNQGNESCEREFFCYESPEGGKGYCIHTYNENKNPLPSFQGEPYTVPLFDTIDENINFYWSLLDDENKISIVVKEIEKGSGKVNIEIINKNKG